LKEPDVRFCPLCRQSTNLLKELETETGQPRPAIPTPALPDADRPEPPRLIIREPGQPQREASLDRDSFTIGRRPDNDIILSFGYVSGHHGRLEQRGDTWHYVDLGSTNGIFVNGKLLQSADLNDGDILRIGDLHGNSVSLTFQAVGLADVPAPAFGTMHIRTTSLEKQPSLLIGRDPQADIPLSAPVVSRQHARLNYTPQGHVLTDLNSVNGTFLNGERLERPALLRDGDVVQIGPFTLVYGPDGLQQYTSAGGVRLDGLGLVREVGRG